MNSESLWHCPQCTFSNKPNVLQCEICGFKRNGASGDGKQEQAAAKIGPKRPSTAIAAPNDPPMLLPIKQESEFMEALRAIEESEANEQYQTILQFCRQVSFLIFEEGFRND